MSQPEFDIIFRGDIVLGHQLASVKLKLQQLFKVDAAKIDSLFTGRPVPLKRKLDATTAQKYRDVLLKAGAQVDLRPSEETAAPKAVSGARSATPAPRPAATVWSLAPVGAELLPASQRPPAPTPVAVDISGLSLRPQEGDLLDPQERPATPLAEVSVPALEVAEVGTPLLEDSDLPLPLVELDLADWDIAEAGADLLRAEERPPVVPVAVRDLNASLAPPGSDLGQLKPAITPHVPDISGLRLADQA